MSRKLIRLKNAIPDIFSFINHNFTQSAESLNAAYLGHSGEKYVTPIVVKNLTKATMQAFTDIFGETSYDYVGTMPQANKQQLGDMITFIFSDKWNRLAEAMALVYDPIENYAANETEKIEEHNTGTVTDNGTKSSTDSGTVKNEGTTKGTQTGTVTDKGTTSGTQTGTVTDEGTETGTDTVTRELTHGATQSTESSGTADTQNNIFGFNTTATDGVPSDKSTGTNSVKQTVTNGGKDTETVTDTRNLANGNTRTDDLSTSGESSNTRTDDLATSGESSNTRTDNLSHSETAGNTRTDDLEHTLERTLNRHGNIGVTTSQQMLQSEIELRQWSFFEQVFADIDSILTIPVF